ncbi:glycosyltransferase [Sphingomonas ginsenosidivorax]|uniref:Glycosyltransferase n=1 Tax=Sphingomonas ginsenosidivorax TaxID=862135 RepID=A0A5C6UCN8_9SPHN|nr:galactosyltransferase-related protein [Sphingomonas ginsenosidivorax]TXC70482.1 glycosyltransferase [Sphingomonas ginsenosidivorax]
MTLSVLTLVRGRRDHLVNLIAGLDASTQAPDELVIAYMQDEAPAGLPATAFPVRMVQVPGEPMPLAAARNRAAEAARGETLVFLDVDCIPSPTLVARYAETAGQGVRLGEVLYLPAGATEGGLDPERLDRLGVRHPAKPAIALDEVRPTPDHGELWGLSFALSATDWAAAGGMDERYVGYGAEETDFAARLEAAGVPMAWVGGARAWHQHHAVHMPPYQHFDSILRNAALFRATWGRWCMDYWLGQFAERGMIRIDDAAITVLRHPNADEIAASRMPDTTLFS